MLKYVILSIICVTTLFIIYLWYEKIKRILNNKDIKKYSRRRPSYLSTKPNGIDNNEKIYIPTFIINQYNSNINANLSKGEAKLNIIDNDGKHFGHIISKNKYKNISSMTAIMDLTHLTKFNYINTSLYLINYSTNSKINILDAIGNKVFKSSTSFTNQNILIDSPLNNIIDPRTDPFSIKMVINYEDIPSIVISVLQNDETNIIYEQKVDYTDLIENMRDGYWIVYSFTQEYVPSREKYGLNNTIASSEITEIKIKGKEV